MKSKKLLPLFFVLACALALVLGSCGGGGGSQKKAGDSITLQVWHIWPDSLTGEGATINKFVKQFNEAHPNIIIQQDSSETESYKTKLKTAFAGGDLPDVYFSYGSGFSKPFVETGRVMRLDTEYPAAVLERLMPGTDANAWYDGKLYGLPLKMWAGTLYANTALFEKYNLKVPATWDELIQVSKDFRKAGLQPLCLGAKDGWHIAMYFDQIALREVGVDGIIDAMNGRKKFTDPEFLAAAEKLRELIDAGGFMNGFMGLGAQEAQAEFFMGKIPLYFNGSWLTGDVQNPDNQIKDIVNPYPFPDIPGGKGAGTYTGGAIDIWSVSNETKHKAESLQFMQELCEFMSVEGYKAGDGIAVWKNNVSAAELNPVLNKINTNLETAKGYSLAWDTQLSGADIDTYLKNLQALAGGQLSPRQFTEALQNGLSVAMK
ncbi:putative ABC transporter extracellular-binding protein YurO [Spirochaetia bacterium]|nr:putative ABC transporter extracellular-binding protein YurO [Spirochaetia bacterium]